MSNKHMLKQHIQENTALECTVSFCHANRHVLSPYCKTHHDRLVNHGDPHQRPINWKDMSHYKHKIKAFIDEALITSQPSCRKSGNTQLLSKEDRAAIIDAYGRTEALMKNAKYYLSDSLDMSKVDKPLTYAKHKNKNYPLHQHTLEFLQKPKDTMSTSNILARVITPYLFHRDYPELLMSGDPLLMQMARSFAYCFEGRYVFKENPNNPLKPKKMHLVKFTSKPSTVFFGLRVFEYFKDVLHVMHRAMKFYHLHEGYTTKEEYEPVAQFKNLEKEAKTNPLITPQMLSNVHKELFNGKEYTQNLTSKRKVVPLIPKGYKQ